MSFVFCRNDVIGLVDRYRICQRPTVVKKSVELISYCLKIVLISLVYDLCTRVTAGPRFPDVGSEVACRLFGDLETVFERFFIGQMHSGRASIDVDQDRPGFFA